MFQRLEKSWFWQVAICVVPALVSWLLLGWGNTPVPAVAFIMGVLLVLYARWQRNAREKIELANLNRRSLEAKAWYFEGIVRGSANIIFTTDADHRIMKFNEGSERAFGQSQAEVLGREVQTLFADPESINHLLGEVDRKGAAELPEAQTKHPGAEPVWLSLSVTRMRNRENEIIGEVFNGANITARKRLDDELRRKNEQLLLLSLTDGLTGLYNIRHLHSELARLCQARRRFPQRALSVAIFDVDCFKSYNDTQGHPAGDALLVELARILKQAIRQGMDTAYRMGGDEFVLVLPDTREEGAQVICDRVLQAYRKAGLGSTSLSIGIATDRDLPPPIDADAASRVLLARADQAMYVSKGKGGDQLFIEALA